MQVYGHLRLLLVSDLIFFFFFFFFEFLDCPLNFSGVKMFMLQIHIVNREDLSDP